RRVATRAQPGQGGTRFSRRAATMDQLRWKDEGQDPTGSHKDRAQAVAVSAAREAGIATVVLASAGSTGLTAAATLPRPASVAWCSLRMARIKPLRLYGSNRHPLPRLCRRGASGS